MGAAIGAGVGDTGGFLYGKHKEGEHEAYQDGVSMADKRASSLHNRIASYGT
jgi:hypothetical protein